MGNILFVVLVAAGAIGLVVGFYALNWALNLIVGEAEKRD